MRRETVKGEKFRRKSTRNPTFHVSPFTILESKARTPYGIASRLRSGCLKMGTHFLHVGFERIRHGEGSLAVQLEDRPVDHV